MDTNQKNKRNRKKPTSKNEITPIIPSELDVPKFDIVPFDFNPKQIEFIKIANDPATKLLLVDGPAGTSKTLCSIHCALWELKKRHSEEILYIRTAIESGDQPLGFLPGDLDDKFNPYTTPLDDKLDELLSPVDKVKIKGCIKPIPVNFIRGHSWKRKIVIADEMQNASLSTLKTLLTRIGEDSKVFILGDRQQSDIGSKSGFGRVVDAFDNEVAVQHGVRVFRFTEDDIVRSELCKFITKSFSKLESLQVKPKGKGERVLLTENKEKAPETVEKGILTDILNMSDEK